MKYLVLVTIILGQLTLSAFTGVAPAVNVRTDTSIEGTDARYCRVIAKRLSLFAKWRDQGIPFAKSVLVIFDNEVKKHGNINAYMFYTRMGADIYLGIKSPAQVEKENTKACFAQYGLKSA